jgi:hypothetical protein
MVPTPLFARRAIRHASLGRPNTQISCEPSAPVLASAVARQLHLVVLWLSVLRLYVLSTLSLRLRSSSPWVLAAPLARPLLELLLPLARWPSASPSPARRSLSFLIAVVQVPFYVCASPAAPGPVACKFSSCHPDLSRPVVASGSREHPDKLPRRRSPNGERETAARHASVTIARPARGAVSFIRLFDSASIRCLSSVRRIRDVAAPSPVAFCWPFPAQSLRSP